MRFFMISVNLTSRFPSTRTYFLGPFGSQLANATAVSISALLLVPLIALSCSQDHSPSTTSWIVYTTLSPGLRSDSIRAEAFAVWVHEHTEMRNGVAGGRDRI